MIQIPADNFIQKIEFIPASSKLTYQDYFTSVGRCDVDDCVGRLKLGRFSLNLLETYLANNSLGILLLTLAE